MLLLVKGESYLARQRVRELKKEALKAGALAEDIDCAQDDAREVFGTLNTPSLFAPQKLLVFHNAFGSSFWEEKDIQEALLKADPHTLVFAAGEVNETDPLFRFLLQKGTIEKFAKLKGPALRTWVQKKCKEHVLSLAPGADDLLMFSCADDAERLAGEIAKLAAFKRFGEDKTVSKEDVLSLVARRAEPKIFSTIDAISAKNRRVATKLLAEHLAAGEAPLQLLKMFVWQFRALVSIKDMGERGVKRGEIARKLRLHPFVAQKSFAAVQRFSFEELKELYRRLFALDLAFKTGKGNPGQLLHLFVGQASSRNKEKHLT